MIGGIDRLLAREGSTRALGLMRIALGLLAWARFADTLLPLRHTTADWYLGAALFFPLSLLFVLGVGTRWVAPLFAAATWYVVAYLGYLHYEPWTHHHVYALLFGITLLALTPCGRSFSVDRHLALRRAERAGAPPPPEVGPQWAVPLIGLHVSVMYVFSAYDKISWAFLSGERLQQSFAYLYFGSDLPPSPWFEIATAVGGTGTVVLELWLAVALWIPSMRRVALPVGLALHALFYLAIPVGIFSLTVAAFYLAFVDPDRFHRGVDRLLGVRPGP